MSGVKGRSGGKPNERVAYACADYDGRTERGHHRTIAWFAKQWGVTTKQLKNFRANHVSKAEARKGEGG